MTAIRRRVDTSILPRFDVVDITDSSYSVLVDLRLVRSPGVSLVAVVATRLLMMEHCLSVGPQLPIDSPLPAMTSWRGAGATQEQQQKHYNYTSKQFDDYSLTRIKQFVTNILELNKLQKFKVSSQFAKC